MAKSHSITIEFTQKELEFLTWALDFIEGGVSYQSEEEQQRRKMLTKVAIAMNDLDRKIGNKNAS